MSTYTATDADILKTHQVNQWCLDNANQGPRAMVTKFDLAWSLERDLGNDIAVVGFYTDDSLKHEVCRLHLSIADWFRA